MRSPVRPHAHRLLLACVVCLALVGGCRARGRGVSDSTFVATMAELRQVDENRSLDSAAKAAARKRVLQGRGLSAEAVERRARELVRDPDKAGAIWQAIDRKMYQIRYGPSTQQRAPGPRDSARAR